MTFLNRDQWYNADDHDLFQRVPPPPMLRRQPVHFQRPASQTRDYDEISRRPTLNCVTLDDATVDGSAVEPNGTIYQPAMKPPTARLSEMGDSVTRCRSRNRSCITAVAAATEAAYCFAVSASCGDGIICDIGEDCQVGVRNLPRAWRGGRWPETR